jgi:hypothetical protein
MDLNEGFDGAVAARRIATENHSVMRNWKE